MAKAPIDIRSLARSHCTDAIQTLAGIMRATTGVKPADRINAATALLNRGYGAPAVDADGREHINITIRKILEIGAPTQPQKTNGQVIDHEPITNGGSDDGHEPTNGEC